MVTHAKAARSARGRFTSRRSRITTTTATIDTPTSSFDAPTRPNTGAESHEAISAPSSLTTGAGLSAGRPPSKLAVTQPYGPLQQTIDGVTTDLKTPFGDSLSVSDASLLGLKPPGQPAGSSKPANQSQEKRVLRSKDGASRTRSELAHFFPDYEEVVFGAPKEPDYITADSILFIVDKKQKDVVSETEISTVPTLPSQTWLSPVGKQVGTTEPPANATAGSNEDGEPRMLHFDLAKLQIEVYKEDPLSEEYYHKAHRRGERREKQLRNIEKEHAMHEKLDLDRVFEELKGQDWLKTMGLSGVTDAEKRKFEAKRDYYIQAIQTLLDKFRSWRDQEKELKAKKEAALAAVQEEDEPSSNMEETFMDRSMLDDTDLSALQLRQEAGLPPRIPPKKIKLRLNFALIDEDPNKPFTSFYSKPSLRDTAMNSQRRGRSVSAFGQPVPELEETDFVLPDNFVTEEALTANARKRRRLKRESKIG